MAVVLSRSELERMQRSVQPDQITDSEARRRRLKEISDDKVKQWPNTLQATRKKKDNWKKERMETEELARRRRRGNFVRAAAASAVSARFVNREPRGARKNLPVRVSDLRERAKEGASLHRVSPGSRPLSRLPFPRWHRARWT
jgi:hypothetical protein